MAGHWIAWLSQVVVPRAVQRTAAGAATSLLVGFCVLGPGVPTTAVATPKVAKTNGAKEATGASPRRNQRPAPTGNRLGAGKAGALVRSRPSQVGFDRATGNLRITGLLKGDVVALQTQTRSNISPLDVIDPDAKGFDAESLSLGLLAFGDLDLKDAGEYMQDHGGEVTFMIRPELMPTAVRVKPDGNGRAKVVHNPKGRAADFGFFVPKNVYVTPSHENDAGQTVAEVLLVAAVPIGATIRVTNLDLQERDKGDTEAATYQVEDRGNATGSGRLAVRANPGALLEISVINGESVESMQIHVPTKDKLLYYRATEFVR